MLKMIYVNLLSCVVGEIGFPDRSVGEESAYNAGDPSSIPRLGRSLGEGIGYPLQYSWAGGSDSKESTCNAEDPSFIPGSGRSPGEGIGYPLQYSWASLVVQKVKNLPAMQETQVRSREDNMATHSSILAWRIPIDRGAWQTRLSN